MYMNCIYVYVVYINVYEYIYERARYGPVKTSHVV